MNHERCFIRMIHQDRVRKAKENALPIKNLNRLAGLYKAMGDVTRLNIALALAQGEMCVCDLAAYLALSASAVSHHLRLLRELTLVKSRRDGQVLYYALDDDHVLDLLRIGMEHIREESPDDAYQPFFGNETSK